MKQRIKITTIIKITLGLIFLTNIGKAAFQDNFWWADNEDSGAFGIGTDMAYYSDGSTKIPVGLAAFGIVSDNDSASAPTTNAANDYLDSSEKISALGNEVIGDDELFALFTDKAGQKSLAIKNIANSGYGYLRAFTAINVVDAAYYGDGTVIQLTTDTMIVDNPAGVANCSTVNPAYSIPFDSTPMAGAAKGYIEGSVDASSSGGNNQLQSSTILIEWRYDGESSWNTGTTSVNGSGDFNFNADVSHDATIWVRARVKNADTPRNGFPISQEVSVVVEAIIAPVVVITNSNANVAGTINTYDIGGSNNVATVGNLAWVNDKGGSGFVAAGSPWWTISDIPLSDGANVITNVEGTVTTYDIGGSNNVNTVGNLAWVNDKGGSGFVAVGSPWWTISDIPLSDGANVITVTGTNVAGVEANDIVTITRINDVLNTNGFGVLCTWPELIGKQQTGTVEFVSQGGSWTLLVGTQEVASGTCTAGWNVIDFRSENLPVQNVDSFNQLVLTVGDLSFGAGTVTVVDDDLEVENPTDFVRDFDGDLIYVKYISKTGGEIRAEGRTIFIDDGSADDKLMVTVKAAKGEGDGVCRISGIICNGDIGMVKVMGTVDKLIVNGSLSKLMLRGGSLGHNCKTKLHNVRFESAAGKSKITLVAGKNKTNKKIILANVFANILCGKLNDDNSIEPQILKMLAIKGGNLGIENVKRRIDAEAVSIIMVKPKGKGGDILDYSFYLTDEEKPGRNMSFKKLIANNIIVMIKSNLNQ